MTESRFSPEEREAIRQASLENLRRADELLATRRDPTNLLFMPPRKEPEPEERVARTFPDTTIARMVHGVREETASQFAALREEIEADINEIHNYVAGELSSLLAETLNCTADELNALHEKLESLRSKGIESDISALQSDVVCEISKSDLAVLTRIVEGLVAEVAGLRDDVASVERSGGGKMISLKAAP